MIVFGYARHRPRIDGKPGDIEPFLHEGVGCIVKPGALVARCSAGGVIDDARPAPMKQAQKVNEVGQLGWLRVREQRLIMRGRGMPVALLQGDKPVARPDRGIELLLCCHERSCPSRPTGGKKLPPLGPTGQVRRNIPLDAELLLSGLN